MAFEEDLSEFFDTADGFGVAAVIDNVTTVNGIIDHNYVDVTAGFVDVTVNEIVFICEYNDLPMHAVDKAIVIENASYLISSIKQDGTGRLAKVRLKKQKA